MPTIPQKELRNNSGEILRRAEGGEHFTITVAGRPVADLGPHVAAPQWVDSGVLAPLWELPPDPQLGEDLADFDGELRDPWDR
jgi:prevent-host-death family protein